MTQLLDCQQPCDCRVLRIRRVMFQCDRIHLSDRALHNGGPSTGDKRLHQKSCEKWYVVD